MTRRVASRRGDRGAFLLIFALTLTAILIFVAFTVDLGQARFSKRSEQQLADLASLSAGRQMAGYGTTSSGTVVARPRDACVAATESIRTNEPDFTPSDSEITDGDGNPATIPTGCVVLPVDTSACTATTLPISATVFEAPYLVTVRWPVLLDDLPDVGYLDGGVNDGNAGIDRCERLSITVQRTDDTAFAGVIGVDDLTTEQSAVIRASLESENSIIPAFLILERSRCGALTNSANGSGSFGIQIHDIEATPPDKPQPGTIHVDTTANNGCSGNAENSVAVYGTSLSSGGPSINLHPSTDGVAGLLYVVATANQAKVVPTGINATPQSADVVSRAPVDDEFNDDANPAIADADSDARTTLSTAIGVDDPLDGWRRFDCGLNPVATAAVDPDTAAWYVDCDDFQPTTGLFQAAVTAVGSPTTVVFDGGIDVGNETLDLDGVGTVAIKGKLKVDTNGVMDFGEDVEHIYVGGQTFAANVNESAVKIDGELMIRETGVPTETGPPANPTFNSVCVTTASPGFTTFVVYGDDGPNFDAAGDLAMCNTFLYLAGNTLSGGYVRETTTSGGACTVDLPCPKTTGNAADAGNLEFNGLVDWTAPNTTSGPPPNPRGIEDLMFWSESSATTDVKAGAKVLTQGVFIAPNMNVEFRSPATGSPRNAQFIARRLELLQGTLDMKPLPNDSTPIPSPGSFTIIR